MRRILGILAWLLALGAIAFSHSQSSAQPRAEKQLLCHVTGQSGAHIIEVSVHAVPAHLRNHGDCMITSTDRSLIGTPCDPTDANGNDICDIQP